MFPQYAVARPVDLSTQIPAAIALPRGQAELLNVVDSWITVKRDSGYVQELFNHWVMGKEPEDREPRWSILRNVLGVGLSDDPATSAN